MQHLNDTGDTGRFNFQANLYAHANNCGHFQEAGSLLLSKLVAQRVQFLELDDSPSSLSRLEAVNHEADAEIIVKQKQTLEQQRFPLGTSCRTASNHSCPQPLALARLQKRLRSPHCQSAGSIWLERPRHILPSSLEVHPESHEIPQE